MAPVLFFANTFAFLSEPNNKTLFQYLYQFLQRHIVYANESSLRTTLRVGRGPNGRMGMKIILMQDFESLGFEGDIVDVARGYARNYLFPKGVAIEASNSNVKAMDMRKGKIVANRTKDKEAAERVREKISQVTITVRQKVGEEGRLYGSVTSRDIAQELESEGIVVDRRKIVIDETIRALGEFEVPIKLHPEVMAKIKVVVEGEEEEA